MAALTQAKPPLPPHPPHPPSPSLTHPHPPSLTRTHRTHADKNVAILLDTKGPEIRTGFFNEKCKGKIHLKVRAHPHPHPDTRTRTTGSKRAEHTAPRRASSTRTAPHTLHPLRPPRTASAPSAASAATPPRARLRQAGSIVELTTDYTFKGDETKFACTYDKLPTSVKPGSLILIADGSLVLVRHDPRPARHSPRLSPRPSPRHNSCWRHNPRLADLREELE